MNFNTCSIYFVTKVPQRDHYTPSEGGVKKKGRSPSGPIVSDSLLFLRFEHILSNRANGANPFFGKALKGRSGLNAGFGIPLGGIVDIPTHGAYVFLHCSSRPLSVVVGIISAMIIPRTYAARTVRSATRLHPPSRDSRPRCAFRRNPRCRSRVRR